MTTVKFSLVTRLYILDFGLMQVKQDGRIIGIPGYLIQTQDGHNILVDTGFPAWYADDPHRAMLEDGLDSFGYVLELTHEYLPPAQLARAGLSPADITDLVLTHSDIDHVGGIGDFPQATLIVSRAERELARPRYFEDKSPIPWPESVHYRLIEQDTELYPGLTLLPTPGHAPGHLSLLVQLPRTGPVLLTGDAIAHPTELTEGFEWAWNEGQARASAVRLMTIAQQQQAWIIYGHDSTQWPVLAKAPEFYD